MASPSPTLQNCASCEVRSMRMFCNLSGQALTDYANLGVDATFPRGATLFLEDSPPASVFVLCHGQVKLSCTSREGKTLILKMAMPGDVLGLGAVVSNSPYEVSAETATSVRIKNIRREDFMAFLKRHGEGSLHAAKSLAEEYKAAFFDARRLALSGSAAGRLAGVLLDWGKSSAACGQHQQMRFTMALTHEELASLVGSSRETITRMLGRFRKERLIEVHGASIIILSPDGLEQLCA